MAGQIVLLAGLVLASAFMQACNRVEVASDPLPALPEPLPATKRADPPKDAPSFVLVTIDTLRADHVGAYGAADAETPTLDRLASEGVLFETAIASAPLTLPAHTSILTGLYPPRHGVRHNAIFRVSEQTPSVATHLHEAGWQTGAFVGAAVLAAEFGLSRGFDRYDDQNAGDRSSVNGFPERRAEDVTSQALAWLQTVDGPYFLWVHYYDPHAAYAPPEPWAERFAERPYDGEIAYVDAQLGRLLEGLEGRKDRPSTFLIVTSDHGEGLGEHGEPDHSYLVYDADLHVPLIVTGPEIERRRVSGVVSHVSIAPTLLSLAGLAPEGPLDAPDLTPLLRGAPETGELTGWAYAESLAGRLDHGWSSLHAIRTDDHHYVRAPQPEVFDLASDPGQLHNRLSPERSDLLDVARQAEARIEALFRGARGLETVEIDAERRAQVEALGYVVPDGVPQEGLVHPKDALPFARLSFVATAHLLRGDYDEALEVSARVLERFPDSYRMHDVAARSHLNLKALDPALRHAQRCVELFDENVSTWMLLAMVHLERNDPAAARQAYRAALVHDPGHVDPQIGLMRLDIDEDLRAAEQRAQALLGEGCEEPRLCERIAATWEIGGEFERAFESYTEAVRRFPEDSRLNQRLAIQFVRRGEDEAAARYQARVDPERIEAALLVRLAIAYAARGTPALAIPVLENALARDPEDEGARHLLLRVQRENQTTGG
ncbi:MAG: sulfatase-like hydrolase/transferase [Deltaproteobacteria bacterium]|nr:sulfatase-like hydrolase/transferase [Deltaproteobacteria bacterium]MBW2394939.1 sulfatase-like hydrolase/transferase [Deltaproteobacteria bacterium]